MPHVLIFLTALVNAPPLAFLHHLLLVVPNDLVRPILTMISAAQTVAFIRMIMVSSAAA